MRGTTTRVYPRRCGEASRCARCTPSTYGLSPQVRGSHRASVATEAVRRSIPAGAGKPAGRWRGGSGSWVYPRRCGEAISSPLPANSFKGLSPQVRGSRRLPAAPRRARGSIPAGAAKPRCRRNRPSSCRVYPRRCGEAAVPYAAPASHPGLSPQVRGSLAVSSAVRTRAGSIPAGAGKPARARTAARRPRVYPRRCGEADGAQAALHGQTGLSPQVRGSL